MGFRISRLVDLWRRGRAGEELHLERVDHRQRQLALHLEDIGQLAVVLLGPEMEPVPGVDELRRDAHAVARLAHAALEERGDVQLVGDDGQVLVLALEVEGRCPPRHPQAIDLGQGVEDLLGDAVGEVLLVLRGAQVGEGEHGDRGHSLRGSDWRGHCRRPGTPANEEVPNEARSRCEYSYADKQ